MRNVLTMIVAAMLCAGGYATDFKNVTKTRKLGLRCGSPWIAHQAC